MVQTGVGKVARVGVFGGSRESGGGSRLTTGIGGESTDRNRGGIEANNVKVTGIDGDRQTGIGGNQQTGIGGERGCETVPGTWPSLPALRG